MSEEDKIATTKLIEELEKFLHSAGIVVEDYAKQLKDKARGKSVKSIITVKPIFMY